MYDNYSNNNRRETILRSLTKFTTVSVYCQTDDDNTIITASITTEPSKTTSSISSSIESTTQSTTTTTTKTISDIKSTKCIPVIKTVTEKEKVTIKETLTVTVTAVNDKPSHKKCAKKWAQCGGKNYNGPNCCETGSTCHKVSDYYSQCI
ncbi:carbohydrate-binding module family 1 protein [Piromyces sp. E2]|nr:carbohydrate-binding module family 1 protein [Piromyces sp. E2]|eukprot:OUM62006.1 carbohydrate-binding module family 1 protein [Piromyces sp. E2]